MRAGAYATSILLSIASVPLIIRALGVVEYGRFVTITSLMAIVAGVTDAGLQNIGIREYAVLEGAERTRMLRHLIGVRMALTFVGVLLAVAFTLVAGYSSVLVVGAMLAGAGLLLQVLEASYVVSLVATLRLGAASAIDIIRQAVAVGFAVFLVVIGAKLLPFFLMTVVAGVVVLVVTVRLTRGLVPYLPALDTHGWWGLLKDAVPYAAATAIGIVYFRMAIIIMSLVATGEQTGYFSASFRIVEVLAGVPYMLVMSVFPVLARAARDNQERLRYSLQRTFEVSLILGVWTMLAVIVGAPFAIHVVAGSSFDPSIPVLRIQGAAMAATFLVATWGYALLSLRRYKPLLLANGFALALTVGLTLALAPDHGARGAAVSMTITEVTLALVYIVVLTRARPDLRVSLRILPAVVAGAVIGGALALLSGIPSGAGIVVASVCYVAVLWLAGAIPSEVRDVLRRRSARTATGG
jgi:O-antigen/teichoic acid export membrane protein